MRMRRLFSPAVLVLLAAGCQTPNPARYISRTPEGGVVAIPRDTPGDRDRAFAMITRHVGPNFVVEKEEEILLDQQAWERNQAAKGRMKAQQKPWQDVLALNQNPSSEYRIYYHRSTAAATPTAATTPPTTATPTAAAPAPLPVMPAALPPAPAPQSSGIVPASASMPVPTSNPMLKEGLSTTVSGGIRSYLPLTCEGCQGR
jgi:hypothetical protein